MPNTTSNQSIKRLQKTAKRGTKAAKLSILTELCYKIDQVKQKQNRIPYGFVSQLVAESKSVIPWVTRDAINNHYRRLQHEQQKPPPPLPPPVNEINLEGQGDCPSLMSNLTDENSDGTHIPPALPTILPTKRLKGGRAKGETEKKRQKLAEAIVAAKNEITEIFLKTMKTVKAKKSNELQKALYRQSLTMSAKGATYQLASICRIGQCKNEYKEERYLPPIAATLLH